MDAFTRSTPGLSIDGLVLLGAKRLVNKLNRLGQKRKRS